MARLQYKHKNGYTAVLYGSRGLMVRDSEGKEIFHTAFRSVNTEEEVMQFLEEFPEFYKLLTSLQNS